MSSRLHKFARAGALCAMLAFSSHAWAQTVAPSDDVDPEIRIQQLENQLRQLTGRNEELQYRNRQLEDQIRQLQAGAPPTAPARPNVAMAPQALPAPAPQPGP